MEVFTLKDFIKNPTGKGTSFMGSREILHDAMNNKFKKLKKNIKMDIYSFQNSYFFVFKIPSESVKDFYYDVVLCLYSDTAEIDMDNNITRYKLDFFSNMHSFVYTYANILYNNNMIVKGLEKKYPSIILKKGPEKRNPNEVFGFEKSTYISALYINSNIDFMNKDYLRKIAKPIKRVSVISKKIRDFETIDTEYKKKKKSNKKGKKHSTLKKGNKIPDKKKSTKTNKIKSITKTKSISKTKRIKKK